LADPADAAGRAEDAGTNASDADERSPANYQ
jgi:hypothetical protein